jgi:DNA-binding beta-propeller fold protein YncE
VGHAPGNSATNGQILIIDDATCTTQALPLAALPFAVAVNQVTNQIYTANIIANTISAIDGATLAATSFAARQEPAALAVNSTTNKI